MSRDSYGHNYMNGNTDHCIDCGAEEYQSPYYEGCEGNSNFLPDDYVRYCHFCAVAGLKPLGITYWFDAGRPLVAAKGREVRETKPTFVYGPAPQRDVYVPVPDEVDLAPAPVKCDLCGRVGAPDTMVTWRNESICKNGCQRTVWRLDEDTTEEVKQAIVITGNPIDGLVFTGPFETREDAIEWAEDVDLDPDWWIADLDVPEVPEGNITFWKVQFPVGMTDEP